MSIRYKANFSQQLASLDYTMAKYPNPSKSHQPSTPEFINSPPQHFQDLGLLREAKTNFSSNMVGLKEQNIKSLDDRINNIMKKHQRRDAYSDIPTPAQTQNNYLREFDPEGQKYQSTSPYNSRHELLKSYQQNTQNCQKENKREMKQEWRRLRERSMILFDEKANKSGQNLNPQKKQSRKSSKENKYDSQIQQLNERIKLAEENKKKFKIDFSPFSKQSKSDYKAQKSSINEQLMTKLQAMKQNQISFQRKVPEVQRILCQSVSIEPKGCIRHQKNTVITNSNNFLQTPVKTTPFNLKDSQHIFNNTQQVHSKSMNKHQTSVTARIVQAFIEQIKLDEQLRNLKIWFTFSNEKDKWDYLMEQINRKNIKISQSQVKSIFQSGIQEHNPFFRWEGVGFGEGVEALLMAYQNTQSHWYSHIFKGWSSAELSAQNLKKSLLYDDRSSTIAIQDLVRFINMQKDAFYRNRDLFLIYRRLWSKTTNKLEYSSFIQALSK